MVDDERCWAILSLCVYVVFFLHCAFSPNDHDHDQFDIVCAFYFRNKSKKKKIFFSIRHRGVALNEVVALF